MFVLRKNPDSNTFSLVNGNVVIGGICSRLQLIYTIARLIYERRITGKNLSLLIESLDKQKTLPAIATSEIRNFPFPATATTKELQSEAIIKIINNYRTVLMITAHHLQAHESFRDEAYPHIYFYRQPGTGMLFAQIYLSPVTYEYRAHPFYFVTKHEVSPEFFTQEDGVGIVLNFQETGRLDLLSAERLITCIEHSKLITSPDTVINN